MQKIVAVIPTAYRHEFASHFLLAGVVAHYSAIDATHTIVAFVPKHWHTRFGLASIPGITVLPNHHDASPIGADAAASLVHVDAQPHETMWNVALRLHEKHGPAFHPAT